MAPSGVVQLRRRMRFARLMQRRGRDLGGSSVRAAFSGDQMLTASPRWVVPHRMEALTPAGGRLSADRRSAQDGAGQALADAHGQADGEDQTEP
jgi:hypothetical protein